MLKSILRDILPDSLSPLGLIFKGKKCGLENHPFSPEGEEYKSHWQPWVTPFLDVTNAFKLFEGGGCDCTSAS